ncbi:MAG: hypothetical protein JSS29_07845 [Proteobacteria bacterium]|nr:hypothetical protein [Pseudomonadota bacterium]
MTTRCGAGLRLWMTAMLGLGAATAALAEPAIPPELRDWAPWVLEGHESQRCPWLAPARTAEPRICAWPGVLELTVDAHGGRFSERWEVGAPGFVPLPGRGESWPEAVTLDGHPAALVAHAEVPSLWLTAGTHEVSGTFSWERRPEVLGIPEGVGLIALTLDGTHIGIPQRTGESLVLGGQASARADNRLELHVFRRLEDGVPALLTTRLMLSVAGEAREVRLPQALPAGFVPTGIEGDLAARLDPDNTLRIQVRPGSYAVNLTARGPNPLAEVNVGSRAAPWPAEEVWSFASDDSLRVTALEGVPPTDPAQANVPTDWHDLPAYRITAGAVLRVVERSRGLATGSANELRLARRAWLDFSGAGYTVLDTIAGTMQKDWRLDMSAPYALRSASGPEEAPLLVTTGTQPGTSGVELRTPEVAVSAVARLPRALGAQPATGWRERFTQVRGELIVGPGYRLIAALGPDRAPEAWLERWGLLDVFAMLLIATVAWRVFGIPVALLSIAAVALTHQEPASPTWLWLNLLVALALLRAAPEGRLRRWAGAYRWLALALLLWLLVPFAVTQVRLAVYPQLETFMAPPLRSAGIVNAPTEALAVKKLDAPPPPPAAAPAPYNGLLGGNPARDAASSSIQEVVVVTAERRTGTELEPGVQVQAGPGLPDWRYHAYEYGWNGPLEADATVRFLISPPWLTRLWRLAGVALSLLLLFRFARGDLPRVGSWLREHATPRAAAVAVLLVCAVPGVQSRAQAATTPDPQLLNELRTRLLAPPRCLPDCAAILDAHVEAGERLSVVLEVSALDAVGIALPGAENNWAPQSVQVDGQGGGWVFRNAQGVRFVSVPAGRHTVRLEGPLAGLDGLALAFPLAPRHVEVSTQGWDANGVSNRRLVSGALQLVRRQVAAPGSAGTARQEEFPAYVVLSRDFSIAHDWNVTTQLARVAPRTSAFTVRVPLLPQEAVTSPGLEAKDGAVVVGLAAGAAQETFTSVLPVGEGIDLVAGDDRSFAEHWVFHVSPAWHAEFEGLPAVSPDEGGGVWAFEYYPRPGERLHVHLVRPAAVPGNTVAFDRASLQVQVGKRSSEATLSVGYRSTQGGRQVIHLPPHAAVTSVTSDGQELGLRPQNDELALAALPGRHAWAVTWQSPDGVATVTRSPPVTLSSPSSNITLDSTLPDDRWVLYAAGPGVGPAILYWGELLVFLIAALLLGRSRLTPLPVRDWLLLGLGLSTLSWAVLALFVAFAAVFQWRSHAAAPSDRSRFNALQLALAVLALAALFAVVAAVPAGLLAHPDMRFAGSGSLHWFVDQSPDALPRAAIVSVSLWWYKVAILAWALWLSFALTRWVRWAWQVYSRDGLWRAAVRPPAPPPPASA